MIVSNGEQAREWLSAWGDKAFSFHRAHRLADDMRANAMSCGDRLPVSRDGYLEAESVLREAIDKNS